MSCCVQERLNASPRPPYSNSFKNLEWLRAGVKSILRRKQIAINKEEPSMQLEVEIVQPIIND